MKNEAILGRVVGNSCILVHFHNDGGILQLLLFQVSALGLKFAELLERFFEQSSESASVGGKVGHDLVLLAIGFGLGVSTLASCSAIPKVRRLFSRMVTRLRRQGGVAQDLDELHFDGAFGLAFREEFLVARLIDFEVVGWPDDSLTGEAVAHGVEGRALFAGCGAWAGGVL